MPNPLEIQLAFVTDPLRQRLDWNEVNALVEPLDMPETESPIPLVTPEGEPKDTFDTTEVRTLKNYIGGHAELIVEQSAMLFAEIEGVTKQEDMERTGRFLHRTIDWLGRAADAGSEVRVVELLEFPDEGFITR